jgi:hypothetical protein
MPIILEHKDAGVIVAHWQNVVTIEDVIHRTDDVRQLADQHGDGAYSVVVDLTEVTRIPVDLTNLRSIVRADPRVLAFLIVDAPAVGRMVGQILSKLTTNHFEFFDRLEDAVNRAGQLYAQRQRA